MRRNRGGMSAIERRQRSRLAQLVSQAPLLRGNIVQSRRKCGNKNCRCQKGQLHVSKHLYVSLEGKRRSIHIPRDWEPKMAEWVKNYKEARRLLEQLSLEQLKRFQNRQE